MKSSKKDLRGLQGTNLERRRRRRRRRRREERSMVVVIIQVNVVHLSTQFVYSRLLITFSKIESLFCFRAIEKVLNISLNNNPSLCSKSESHRRFTNMANRAHVPKFGDWTEDSPFTVVFEKASKSRNDANRSNPNEYPDMTPNPPQHRNQRQTQDQPPPNHNVRPRHERYNSREESEFRQSSTHSERNIRVRAPHTPESYGGGGGRSFGNPSEINRRQQQPHIDPPPVQHRPLRNVRGQSSERVASIPPFPISGSGSHESYTLIFDKVKEERKVQSGNVRSYNGTEQNTPSRPINDQQHQRPLPTSPKSCCFPPWGRKSSH
ncbi:unnamed protein product [Cochlearia groenlandica]